MFVDVTREVGLKNRPNIEPFLVVSLLNAVSRVLIFVTVALNIENSSETN
jgi:hypothetical protein